MEEPRQARACRGSFFWIPQVAPSPTGLSTDSSTILSLCRQIRTRADSRIGYGCFVLRESKDKLSMVPRQGQTCRGYSY